MPKHDPIAMSDTIVAPATPPGYGGIGVIRVAGPQVSMIIDQVIRKNLPPRQATYVVFYDETDQVIDEGIAIFFQSPNSFTGEDILELHTHGSPVVLDQLIQCMNSLGVRLARPGEFSERAFLNGKMDLTQAEAIADLITASSKEAARSAIRSLQGQFSERIHALTEQIIQLRMHIEASIDFVDEPLQLMHDAHLQQSIKNIANCFTDLFTDARQGSLLTEGISVVIAGQPNVGKSSLLNALTQKDCAIVTPIPGTTRDVMRERILLDGMPMRLIDTAGLRDSDDLVEQEGIRRAYQEIEQADLLLYVFTDEIPDIHLDGYQGEILFIQNKIDLCGKAPYTAQKNHKTIVGISARFNLGLDQLKQTIREIIGFKPQTEGMFTARRRHLALLEHAKDHVDHCQMQLAKGEWSELAAEDLRLAQLALNEIIGAFTSDDLLGRIFAEFCIGK